MLFRFVVMFFFFFPVAIAFAAKEPWSLQELRRRFEVRGEIYVMNANGSQVLYKAGTWNTWKTRDRSGKIENQWSSNSNEYGPIAIRHSWQVLDDKTIKTKIELFGQIEDRKTDGPLFKKLLKTEERVLGNVEPVTLVTSQSETQRVIVRFTPGFSDGESPKEITEFPVAGTDVLITDNEGVVWANHLTHEGKYCGFATHRGALFLSYHPFPGGKELGIASGQEIELQLDDKWLVTLRSTTPYMPENVSAKVYGVFLPDRKTSKFSASGVMDRNNEKEFVAAIQRGWPS